LFDLREHIKERKTLNHSAKKKDYFSQSRLDDLLEKFRKERPAFAKEIFRARESNPDLFHEMAVPMLEWAEARLGPSFIDTLIHGYCTFVLGVNRSQARYEKERCYQFSSFEDVYRHAYGSEDFMRFYHWGVFLTTFGWGHHLPLYQLYRDKFLGRLRDRKVSPTLLDLGCGSGVWHLIACEAIPDLHVSAIDISPTSIALSEETVVTLGLDHRVKYRCMDALSVELEKPADAGVSCFLLEHLEVPADLLKNLARNIAPRGLAYVTCALTAAECDHIFEFKRESEPISMAEDAGFRLLDCYSSAPANVPETKHYLPRSMGMVLERREGEIW
jgi:ubiquinone/menaquinone biosynthesis C-methylase UbiE